MTASSKQLLISTDLPSTGLSSRSSAQIDWRMLCGGRLQPHHKIRPLWEAMLRQFGGGPGKLNGCHVALFDCLLPLMNSCRATGDDAAAISNLQSVLSTYARVLPLPIPELGKPFTGSLMATCIWNTKNMGHS